MLKHFFRNITLNQQAMVASDCIKQLPFKIYRRGAVYKLVRRGNRTLLYARTVRDEVQSFEIFEIRHRKAGIIKGNYTPESEVFPHDEAFGVWAKAAYYPEKAERLFNIMENG